MPRTDFPTLEEMLDDMMSESEMFESCGTADEACNGGRGCGTAKESRCGGSGCGTAKEACGGRGCGSAKEACGGRGCGTAKEGGFGNASLMRSDLASDPYEDTYGYTNNNTRAELALEEDDDEEDLEDLEDDDDDDDDELDDLEDDIENMSDEDLDKLASDLEDDMDSDEEEVRLSPEEEIQADDMMSVAGAASLIRSEMNANERAELLENASDLRIAMTEGFINESMIMELRESTESVQDMFNEAKTYSKTTVHFSKQARLAQLHSLAVLVSARAHNDPNYIKYKKACKLKRIYKAKMKERYKSEAAKRMRVMYARMKNSKSSIMKRLSDKLGGPGSSR